MAEKQRITYVISRYSITQTEDGEILGDNIPVKAADTRKEAREYCGRMSKRTRKFGYIYHSVKHI